MPKATKPPCGKYFAGVTNLRGWVAQPFLRSGEDAPVNACENFLAIAKNAAKFWNVLMKKVWSKKNENIRKWDERSKRWDRMVQERILLWSSL